PAGGPAPPQGSAGRRLPRCLPPFARRLQGERVRAGADLQHRVRRVPALPERLPRQVLAVPVALPLSAAGKKSPPAVQTGADVRTASRLTGVRASDSFGYDHAAAGHAVGSCGASVLARKAAWLQVRRTLAARSAVRVAAVLGELRLAETQLALAAAVEAALHRRAG